MFGRSQGAYVHHSVVKQNVNLDQTYYDDIDVDVLTVTMAPRSSFRILYSPERENRVRRRTRSHAAAGTTPAAAAAVPEP